MVTKFDGKPLGDFESLTRAVRERQPGDRVKLDIRRGERTLRAGRHNRQP